MRWICRWFGHWHVSRISEHYRKPKGDWCVAERVAEESSECVWCGDVAKKMPPRVTYVTTLTLPRPMMDEFDRTGILKL